LPHEPIDPSSLNLAQRFVNARRARHYQAVFQDEDGEISVHGRKVLADLDRFCRGNQSAFHPDPRTHALLEGRREVLLRLLHFLNIDSAAIAPFVEVIDE
jgi:hypothetical protein